MTKHYLLLLTAALPICAQSPNAARYEAAAAYLDSCNGHAMLVYEQERLVFERYMNGHSADKPHQLASGTKNFVRFIVGTAMEDGLHTLDEKLSSTLTE